MVVKGEGGRMWDVKLLVSYLAYRHGQTYSCDCSPSSASTMALTSLMTVYQSSTPNSRFNGILSRQPSDLSTIERDALCKDSLDSIIHSVCHLLPSFVQKPPRVGQEQPLCLSFVFLLILIEDLYLYVSRARSQTRQQSSDIL